MSEKRSLPKTAPVIAFLIGMMLIVFSEPDQKEILHHLLRDLGIAGVVSAVVYTLIELKAHQQRELQTATEVFDALMGSAAGPEVWQSIKASIVEQGIACESWRLECDLRPRMLVRRPDGAGEVEEEVYVSEGRLTYTLKNFNSAPKAIAINHELQFGMSGESAAGPIPRVKRVIYVVRHLDGRSTSVDLDERQLKEAGRWKSDHLLAIPVNLPPQGTIEVIVEREEAIAVPGEFPWYVFWLTKQPTLIVRRHDNSSLECEVLPRHHEQTSPICGPDGCTWSLPEYLLPGQGFAIMARRSSASSRTGNGREPVNV